MRRPARSALLAGICVAAGSLSVADGTRASESGPWEAGRGGQGCHRSFPTFLWAGSNAARKEGLQGYHTAATEASEVAATLIDAATSEEGVELAVVVLSHGSSFSTSGVSNANAGAKGADGVSSSLHAKSASATFPYTYPAASSLHLALPLLAGEIGVSAQELSLEEVLPTSMSSGMLDDGKLDLVVVTVPDTATVEETDATLRELTSSLEEKSDGRFLLLWTGGFHDAACGRRSLTADSHARRRLDETETTSRTIKMTPDILSGLLTLFLFLFILVTGLGCIGDIECPQSFPKEDPAKGREY